MATIKASLALHDGMTDPLRRIASAVGTVLDSFENLQRTSEEAVDISNLKDARDQLQQTENAVDGMSKKLREADQKQQNFNNSMRSGKSAADQLLNKIKGIAVAIGSVASLQKAINISDQLTSTTARLSFIVDDGGSVEVLEKKVMAMAQRTRATYFDTADAIAKMGANAGAAFSGNNELIAFMEQVNKQFVIGGASAQEQSNAMLQLTQAMAAGTLRGEELNSVLEQAPGIARAIEKYMGIAEGSIKKAAEAGQITATVVKNALVSMADETNAKFESMPKTWAQIWNTMKNQALVIFTPILNRINQIANSERFAVVMTVIINNLAMLASVAAEVLDLILKGGAAIMDNWSWVAPIIYAAAAAFGAYLLVLELYNAQQALANGITAIAAIKETIHAAALDMKSGATLRATVAQHGLNAALLACPITWVVIGIIAIIAALYAAVAAINKFQGTSISATGIIAAAFAFLAAFIFNQFFVPTWNAFADLANFFGNVFNNPVAAVKILFYNMAQTVIGYILNMARAIEAVINRIPGVTVNITSGLDSFYNRLESAAQQVKDESGWKEYVKRVDFIDYNNALDAGYDFGKGVADKVSGIFNPSAGKGNHTTGQNIGYGDVPDYTSLLGDIGSGVGDTAGNTAKIADSMDITEDLLKYMCDIAERQAINRYTTAEVKIEQHNENHIASDMDVDGIMNTWTEQFAEKMDVSAEGVHE